ncbi:MAG: hypothetical protein IJ151_02750 [Bacteroidales bacterium]|nr:hypothetical protein [Bacteroidales bacterium]
MPLTNYINLKALTMDELAGVVNLYPWFGSARKELCQRMSKMGKEAWDKEQYAESAMYVADRKIIADIFRAGREEDLSDKSLEELIKSFLQEESVREEESYHRTVHVVGGDYFTQSQYDNVKRRDDNVFSRIAMQASVEKNRENTSAPLVEDDFCTETMAEIYAEQGYLEQAKHIYSKLLLKNPEKSAYFAALMENLK